MDFEKLGTKKDDRFDKPEAEQETETFLFEIEQDLQNLSTNSAEISSLLEKLPSDDDGVIEIKESLINIQHRISSVLQRAMLLLSLSAASSSAYAQEGSSAAPENSRPHVELEYDNPQRLASKKVRTYKSFIDKEIKKYEELAIPFKSRDGDYIDNLEIALDSEQELSEEQTSIVQSARAAWYVELLRIERKSIRKHARQTQQAYEEADTARQWLADLIHSEEYEKRALAEGLSEEEIQERRKRSKQDSTQFFESLASGDSYGKYILKGSLVHPEALRDQIKLSRQKFFNGFGRVNKISEIQVHEMEHRVTRANEGLSQRAKDLYTEAFITRPYHDKEYANYLATLTELDARKKSFEYQFEKLTNWRCGMPFTSEHKEQAIRLYYEGKFSSDVGEFFNVIKLDYFERIMNELADISELDESENIV